MAVESIAITDALGATKQIAADLGSDSSYYQVTKVAYGADGTETVVSSAAPLPTTFPSATSPNITAVAASTSNTSVLSANTARILATIYNSGSTVMNVALGATASTSVYTVKLPAEASGLTCYWEVPAGYTGAIHAVWAGSPSGNALVTELT